MAKITIAGKEFELMPMRYFVRDNINSPYFDMLADALPNIPYGYREISQSEAQNIYNQNPSLVSSVVGNKGVSAITTNNAVSDKIANAEDPNRKGRTLDFVDVKTLENAYGIKADFESGKLAQVAPGVFVPAGNVATGKSSVAQTTSVELKNAGIAKSNPTAIANKNFINALYQEGFNRDATQKELDIFADKYTVKDSANIILGAKRSPFFSTTKTSPDITPSSPEAASLSGDFKNNDTYKNLSSDQQQLVDTVYDAYAGDDTRVQQILQNALTQAQGVADPYFKSILTLAKSDIEANVAKINGDFEAAREATERGRRELLEDVSTNKEYLTLEQQAELSKVSREFDQDLLNLRDQMAERGLTVSTKSQEAEDLLRKRSQDVVQSSTRQYNLKIKQLEQQASRGETAATKELEQLTGRKMFQIGATGRAAEQQVGTTNLPGIPGYAPAGGISGEIEEQKRRAILADTAAFTELGTPVLNK